MLWRFLVLLWARLWLKKVGALGGAAVATFVGSVLVAQTTRTPCAWGAEPFDARILETGRCQLRFFVEQWA